MTIIIGLAVVVAVVLYLALEVWCAPDEDEDAGSEVEYPPQKGA